MTANRLIARDACFAIACAATLTALARMTRSRCDACTTAPSDVQAPTTPIDARQTADIAVYRALLTRAGIYERGVTHSGIMGSLILTFVTLAALAHKAPTPLVLAGFGGWALVVVATCWSLYSIRRTCTVQLRQIMDTHGLTREQIATG